MDWIKAKAEVIMCSVRAAVQNDELRRIMMFECLNMLLAVVSFVMTAVNIATKEYVLMISTLLFGLLCIANIILFKAVKIKQGLVYMLFAAESFVLLAFFFITGIPNGFSALWACLIPSFAMLIFGREIGHIYSMTVFLWIIFLFWIPAGRALLRYSYTEEFMLRFPFFYFACFMLAFFVETIRVETQRQLVESEKKYKYLYRHDALTGLYNRYGFNEKVDMAYREPSSGGAALFIMDIDDFKQVNDRYGHGAGDEVLKNVADVFRNALCKDTVYCRWGGEEFTAFLQCGEGYDYLSDAWRLCRSIEETEVVFEGEPIKVTASIGVCIAGSKEDSHIAKLVNTADKCLYKAKAAGKNTVMYEEI